MDKKRKYTINTSNSDLKEEQVGSKANILSLLSKNQIPIPVSFVIVKDTFDDFLIGNSYIDKISNILSEINYEDSSNVEKSSKDIQSLIDNGEFAVEINRDITESYKVLSGFTDDTVFVTPSFHAENIVKSSKNYRAIGIEMLLKQVKEVWKDFFSPENLKHRIESEYEGDLTISILVLKESTAESSGLAYNYDPIAKNQEISIIEGSYGNWVDESENYDIYKVEKKSSNIVEKHVGSQKEMTIINKDSKGNFLKKVPISSNWSDSQKVSDSLITAINNAIKSIEDIFNENFVIEWVKEADKLYIRSIDTFQESSNKDINISFETDDLQSRIESELKSFKLNVDEPQLKYTKSFKSISEETKKEELKLALSGTGNEKGESWGVSMIINESKDLDKIENPKVIPVISEKFNIDLDKLKGLTIAGAVLEGNIIEADFPIIANTFKPDEVIRDSELITLNSDTGDVYVGKKKDNFVAKETTHTEINTKKVNNNVEEKIIIPDMSEIKTGIDIFVTLNKNVILPENLTNIDGGFLENFNDIKEIAEKLDSKPLIVKIDSALTDNELMEKLKLIHKFRNQENFRNIVLSFDNIKDLNRMVEIKKLMNTVRLRRSSSLKVYTEVSNTYSALGLDQILETETDGVIINIESIKSNLEIETYDDTSLEKIIEIILEQSKSKKSKVILKSEYDKDFYNKVIKKDLNTIIVSPKDFKEIKEFVAGNEIKKLTPKKKRGRKRKG